MTTGAVTGAPENLGDTFLGFATHETCDGCGAGVAALWLVFLPSGGTLTLCGSHYRGYKKAAGKKQKQ